MTCSSDGYGPNDPKDPVYAEGVIDLADEQRKRRKEEGPLIPGARVMTTRGAGTIVRHWRQPGYRGQVWIIVEMDAGTPGYKLPFVPSDVRRLG